MPLASKSAAHHTENGNRVESSRTIKNLTTEAIENHFDVLAVLPTLAVRSENVFNRDFLTLARTFLARSSECVVNRRVLMKMGDLTLFIHCPCKPASVPPTHGS